MSLELARQALRAGRAQEAEDLCRQLLAAEPRSPAGLTLLGEIAQRAGQPGAAEMLFRRCLETSPDEGEAHFRLARLLLEANRPFDALPHCRRVTELLPENPDGWQMLGVGQTQTRDFEGAIVSFVEATQRHPDFTDAWSNLSFARREAGQHAGAAEAAREALRQQPGHIAARQNLGRALLGLDRFAEARASLEAALPGLPGDPLVRESLGLAWLREGDAARAVPFFEDALRLEPGAPEGLLHLATAWQELGQAERALALLQESLRRRPGHPATLLQLARALGSAERWPEARASLGEALALAPEAGALLDGLGVWHLAQGQPDQALPWLERALAAAPEEPEFHVHRAIALLFLDRYREGWPEYEWRWSCRHFRNARRALAAPRWRGEPLAGRTILLHAEQGFGDLLCMARYVPLVAARGGRVVLEGVESMASLLRPMPGVAEWVAAGEMLPPFDLHCPLMSLPLAFGTEPETIPAEMPYLRAPEPRAAAWRARLEGSAGLKVGLVWAGRSDNLRDGVRSITLPALAPLFAVPGVRFFSLQKGPAAAAARAFPALTDLSEELSDFGETAGLLSGLDLLITVDTAAAHLAGALGRPVWMLLAAVPDWRWRLAGDRSAWYPTMRLFRRSADQAWPAVIDRLVPALAEWVSSQTPLPH